MGRNLGVKTGADFWGGNSANPVGINRLDETEVTTVRLTTGNGWIGDGGAEVFVMRRLEANDGMIGVEINGDGLAALGSGSFWDNRAGAAEGVLKDGKRGTKTLSIFLGDDSIKDVETGGCGLGWLGSNKLAITTLTEAMLPTVKRILDID